MSSFSDLIGNRVYLIFNPNFPLKDANLVMGFYPEFLNGALVVKIRDVDEMGIWVENPELVVTDVQSGKTSKHTAWVLIRWDYILSLVRVPEGEIPKAPKEFGFSPAN